jgi:HEAT repeat protein
MPLFGSNIAALKQKRDVNALVKILQRDDVHLRRDAIRALGDLGDRAAIPGLAAILTSDHPRVSEQMDAAEALGKIADPAAIDALAQANAASIAREKVAVAELSAISEKPYSPGYYINHISADEYTLRSYIAQALGKSGDARALNVLCDILAMDSGWRDSAARDAITRVIAQTLVRDNAEHARILFERVRDASRPVRHWAAHCLRDYPGVEHVRALMEISRDEKEDFSVREAALSTLGKIAEEDSIDDLDELARGPNRAVARLAGHAAIEIRQRRSL